MDRFWWKNLLVVSALLVIAVPMALAEAAKPHSVAAAVLLPDNQTLIVSAPQEGILVYYDTVTGKETRRVEVEFKPAALAIQGKTLFAAAMGSAIVHVLDPRTGKSKKTVKVPGEPIQTLACHPNKGYLYAANVKNEVFAIDPHKGEAIKTKAHGQFVVADPREGNFVYTGTTNHGKDRIIVSKGPRRGTVRIRKRKGSRRSSMFKYAVEKQDLRQVAVNDNAATNGRAMAISPDGKRIAMAGGGGWSTGNRGNYAIAVFDTADIKTVLGQFDTGAYPSGIAFHPVLNLGAGCRSGNPGEIIIFNGKSFVKKDTFKLQNGSGESFTLLFGGKGTKLISIPTGRGTGQSSTSIQFFSLSLTEQEREALKKAYPE
jgi:hypothetical protein